MSDALIIGGGVAGAALAIQLAQAGQAVTLIEKEQAAQDKVCGEFLSHEAVGYLSALNIDLDALGAVPIDAVRFAEGERLVERLLPFVARSVSRRVLDEALLSRAADIGVNIVRGRTVQGLERAGQGWTVRASPAFAKHASTAFLCSGKHDVRGWKRPAGKQNDLVGFKMHWRLEPEQTRALSRHVELFIFPGGYGGLEPVEEGKANLCFLIRRAVLESLPGGWEGVLAHIRNSSSHLCERLKGATPLWDKSLAITAIPYGHVCRSSPDGLWRLGDQAAVIPSFSGDGMSIALHSARLAASTFLSGGTADNYQRRLAADVEKQVALATTISRALVSPGGQALCALAAGWMPWAIGAAARATRIPDKALAA